MRSNQEWLDALKVGDPVLVQYGRYRDEGYYSGAVAKITPKRRFSIVGSPITFRSDGHEITQDKWSAASVLVEPTDALLAEIRDRRERAKLVAALSHFDRAMVAKLPLDDVRSLLATIVRLSQARG